MSFDMKKRLIIFVSLFAIDQYIKSIFVNGYGLDGEYSTPKSQDKNLLFDEIKAKVIEKCR
jgi:hypothetical protein